jgi:aminoglycoside phosphotransferase (APT) family kinase protein
MADVLIAGFDVPAISSWLPTVTEVQPPLTWTRMTGGRSNLTYELEDARGRHLIIRRPPQGQLLPKAHDMRREFRVLQALWPTDVPVAEPIAYCDDRLIAETHFYVMAKVEGKALHTGADVIDWLDESARRRASEEFIDVLTMLHSLDPDDVGLADLGRHGDYVARQLRTWYGSWTATIDSASFDDPCAHELYALLTEHIPVQHAGRVVHGDYGPHNCLFSPAGTLMAVIDWEIATIGEAIADFAYSMNAWAEPGDPRLDFVDLPTVLTGFLSRRELIERYTKAVGTELPDLNYYCSLNWFKTACILQGVYARYRAGKISAEGVNLDALFLRIGLSLKAAAATARNIQ